MPDCVSVRPSVQVPDDGTPILTATHNSRPGARCRDAYYGLSVTSEKMLYG